MKLILVFLLAATAAALPRNDWPPKTAVSVGCGTSFDLNDDEEEDVEFESELGVTGECDVTITAPKGYHVEVACSGAPATANDEDAEDFYGPAPVKIVFNLENEDSQVFCRVGLAEEYEDIKELHGWNGVDTNIEEFEAAFNIHEKNEKNRAAILAANEEMIKRINADRSGTWTAGVTSMSDKTMEEIQELYTGLPPLPSQEERDLASERAERELLEPLRRERDALPESVDLTTMGRVSPAKSQAGCGSCAAFAAGSTIESCMHKITGILPTDISEQHLLDCAWPEADQGANICRAAWPKRYHEWLHETNEGGIANEGDYPYAHNYGSSMVAGPTQCDPAVRNTNHGAVVTSHQQSWSATEEDIMRLLAAGHSVTTSFKAKGGFGAYRTGIYQESTCTNHREEGDHESINHAVAIVGYGEEGGVKFWKFKNSWGTGWGENGIGKIVRGGGHCGFAMEFSVPFCSASSVPVTTAAPTAPPTPSPNGKCGGHLTKRKGKITSEGFPTAYKNDQKCTWIIQPKGAKQDQVLEITVKSLAIEEHEKCIYDYLRFTNPNNSPISLGTGTAAGEGKICGKTLPEPIISTQGPSVHVEFVTDGSEVDAGFKLTYKLKTKETCKNQKLATNVGVAPVNFNSPNHPGEYGNDVSCDWTISVPEGYKVSLMFDAFETEKGYDKVTVYDGEGTDSPQIKVLDGPNIPESVQSSGNKMTVTFTSDGSETMKGFKASASATDLTPVRG